MEFFQKKIGPVFLKEDSDARIFINKMTELLDRAQGESRQEIEKQIKLASYGLVGEKNIAFELKNSDIDMYILHDLYFEHNGIQAQIDYMVITRKRIYVIECKNLIGNIEIDNGGNFVRTYELFGKKVKEGLYSPITQNERHRLVIKGLRMQEKNVFTKLLFEKNFDNAYRSIVVLANPKTYLNAKFARKEIKNQVIRADQLVAYIKETDKTIADSSYSNDEMEKLAYFFLGKNIPTRSNYSKKYEEMLETVNNNSSMNQKVIAENMQFMTMQTEDTSKNICPRCGSELILRTAKKGDNAGKVFYGCSSFPKCRYIQNIEQ